MFNHHPALPPSPGSSACSVPAGNTLCLLPPMEAVKNEHGTRGEGNTRRGGEASQPSPASTSWETWVLTPLTTWQGPRANWTASEGAGAQGLGLGLPGPLENLRPGTHSLPPPRRETGHVWDMAPEGQLQARQNATHASSSESLFLTPPWSGTPPPPSPHRRKLVLREGQQPQQASGHY